MSCVDRVMSKRKMAKGGMVEDDPKKLADSDSADYDAIDADELESETEDSSEEDSKDSVSRIMRKRKAA
jgi:hypothetical protein